MPAGKAQIILFAYSCLSSILLVILGSLNTPNGAPRVFYLRFNSKRHYATDQETMQYFGSLECTDEEKYYKMLYFYRRYTVILLFFVIRYSTFYLALDTYYQHLLGW